MTRGKRQGAARTTSKTMSWPAKAGWLASQYWAALTIRRRCFAVTVQAVGRLPPLHLDEGEPLALQRDEVDLPDWRCVAPGHDAVAFEPEEKRNETLREAAASIGPDPLGPLPH